MRHQIENRVSQALSRTIAMTLAESKGLDPRIDLSAATSVSQLMQHGAAALARQGREQIARLGHQHRITIHSVEDGATGPLMLLGAIEADLHDDAGSVAYLTENTSVELASLSAASLIMHLAHHTENPDLFFTLATARLRDLGRGTYSGAVSQDFLADMVTAFNRYDHEVNLVVRARWRPGRDRVVVTAICRVVTVCLAAYVSLNDPWASNETTQPMDDVHHLIQMLRADLLGMARPDLGDAA